MYNKKSVYALNKHDAEAIVYPSAEGETVRLTRQDFNSDAEFMFWKQWSDQDYHVCIYSWSITWLDYSMNNNLPTHRE